MAEHEARNEDDQVYLFDESFQNKILALMSQDKLFMGSTAVEVVKPSYFDNPVHQNIARWAIVYYNAYGDTPTQDVLYQELKNFSDKTAITSADYERHVDLIKAVFNTPVQEIDYIKDQVITFGRQQALRDALIEGARIYEKGDVNRYEEVVGIVNKAMSVGAGTDLGISFMDDIDNLPERLRNKYDRSKLIRTGIDGLDNALLGGMAKGELHAFAGRPGVGKSRVLAHCAATALIQKKNVVVYTHELDEDMWMSLIASRISAMNFEEMVNPANKDHFLEMMQKVKRLKANLRIKYYPNKTINVNHMKAHLARLKAIDGFDPDLIVDDYADLLKPAEGAVGNDYKDMGGVFYDLSYLADLFECPVLTASQPQRFAWFLPRIELEHLADSAMKAFVAYSITTINQLRDEEELGRMRLFTAKVRRGYTGKEIFCNFDKGRVQLKETDEHWQYGVSAG